MHAWSRAYSFCYRFWNLPAGFIYTNLNLCTNHFIFSFKKNKTKQNKTPEQALLNCISSKELKESHGWKISISEVYTFHSQFNKIWLTFDNRFVLHEWLGSQMRKELFYFEGMCTKVFLWHSFVVYMFVYIFYLNWYKLFTWCENKHFSLASNWIWTQINL